MEVGSEILYLGITLDKKLLWNSYLEATVGKAMAALMVCRRVAGKTWGCHPKIMHWMYTIIVRPIIKYGSNGRGEQA